MSDYISQIPGPFLDHAQQCMASEDKAVAAAYMTGVVIGIYEGQELHKRALDTHARQRAEQFISTLGEKPGPVFPRPDYSQQQAA